ncbi:thiamine pyrophosphate-binding protein [Bradyrhizobium canariense]|uniref:thiamine pyrophosphate-binding protein n=1 Tax=Bradyrhizobium canariense TaxID=255045 RepID=UPI0011BA9DC2
MSDNAEASWRRYNLRPYGGHLDSTYQAAERKGSRIIDRRHEQAAGIAAPGDARTTREVCVATVIAGSGVPNVVTPIVNADADCVANVGGRDRKEHGLHDEARASPVPVRRVALQRACSSAAWCNCSTSTARPRRRQGRSRVRGRRGRAVRAARPAA